MFVCVTLTRLRQGESPVRMAKGAWPTWLTSHSAWQHLHRIGQLVPGAAVLLSDHLSHFPYPLPWNGLLSPTVSGGVHLSMTATLHSNYTTGPHSYSTFATTRNSWVSPRRPEIHYSMVWKTFICPSFTWPTIHILWSLHTCHFLGCVPWLLDWSRHPRCVLLAPTLPDQQYSWHSTDWLPGESILSARLKAHPKPDLGRAQGCLLCRQNDP